MIIIIVSGVAERVQNARERPRGHARPGRLRAPAGRGPPSFQAHMSLPSISYQNAHIDEAE